MNQPFQVGHAHAETWQTAARECLLQLDSSCASLGFLYISDLFAEHAADILSWFQQHTEVEHWVGTAGIGICAQDTEYFDQPALAVMLGNFPENSFQIFSETTSVLEAFSRTHQTWCDQKIPLFAVVHGDPRNNQIAELVVQLSEQLGESFLVGGLSSARHQYPQIADGITDGGLSGVLFSSHVRVATRLTQGCSAIGPRHEITECRRNIISRIDGRSALTVFKEDIGEVMARDLSKVASHIFAAFPVPGSDTGDYMVRNLIGIDPQQGLLAIGDLVEPGMPILFTHRDASTAYRELVRMLTALKAQLKTPPKAALYYSCLGRGESLFGEKSVELKAIQEIMGELPLVGFFANGEISHQRLYGYTGVLTLFL